MMVGGNGIRPDEILTPEGGPSQLRRLITDAVLMLPNIAKLLGRLLRDPRVPRRSKIALGIAVAYVASPIDLIPEAIPVIGWADDVVIMMYALDSLIERAGAEIIEEHWDGPGDLLAMVRDVVGASRSILPRRVVTLMDRFSG